MNMTDLLERSKVTTAPVNQPITLAELKAQLRITDSSQDTYLQSLIDSAVDLVELYLSRKLIEQTLTAYLDAWPIASEAWFEGHREGAIGSLKKYNHIELAWLPLISVTSVSSFDTGNNETVFDSANYFVDDSSLDIWGRIILNTGATWPSAVREQNSLKMVYKVGYGPDAADVPAGIRTGLLMVAAWMYSNRGDCSDGSCIFKCGAAGPLGPYLVVMI